MARPVTLFTGQWADLPLEELAEQGCRAGASTASSSPAGATTSTSTRRSPTPATSTAAARSSTATASSASRSRRISSARRSATRSTSATGRSCRRTSGATATPRACGSRAADKVKDTARAAARFGVDSVNGFTGSSVWHLLYSFPPNDFDAVEAGYRDFAERWNPIIDVFDEEGVRFGSRCTRPRSPTTS